MASHRPRHLSLFIRKTFPLAAIFLLLPPVLSCGLNQQRVVPSDVPAGQISASETGFVDNDHLFRALAKIDLMRKDGHYPFTAALVIKKPSHLRLELLPVFGSPDFFLTLTPDKIGIFIPSKSEFYSGRPTSAGVKKFLPWPVALEEMLMIFTGTYPLFPEDNISYRSYRENNILRLEMRAPSGRTQTVWVGENHQLLKFVRRDETGNEVYTAEYLYEDEDAVPEKITVKMADGRTSLAVTYADISLEKAVDLSVFDLAVPAGVNVISLE